MELRELIRKEKMYIYIEGKEPVARKSKSLAEMGVRDGDNLIVTTEMKLPFNVYSEEDDEGNTNLFPAAFDQQQEHQMGAGNPQNAGSMGPGQIGGMMNMSGHGP